MVSVLSVGCVLIDSIAIVGVKFIQPVQRRACQPATNNGQQQFIQAKGLSQPTGGSILVESKKTAKYQKEILCWNHRVPKQAIALYADGWVAQIRIEDKLNLQWMRQEVHEALKKRWKSS